MVEHRANHNGRIFARPAERLTSPPLSTGLHHLEITSGRGGLLYIPALFDVARPAPLMLMLHGAGGSAEQALSLLQPHADQHGIVVLASQSQGRTWDFIIDGFGPDVECIDHALNYLFERVTIDPWRTAVAGFSDGASYALTLGLMNGDLCWFSRGTEPVFPPRSEPPLSMVF